MHLHLFCMYLKLTLLAIVLLLSAPTTRAATDVIKANLYVTDSLNTMTGFKAGESFVLNSQIRDQATNATVGAELCACVNLRDGGPSQCEITLQFASGTVQVRTLYVISMSWSCLFSWAYAAQVAGLQYGLPPAQPYNNLTTGLLAVTGGT